MPEETYSVVFSIDGGQTWEPFGAHGRKPMASTIIRIRQSLRKSYGLAPGRVKVHQITLDQFPAYGLDR